MQSITTEENEESEQKKVKIALLNKVGAAVKSYL